SHGRCWPGPPLFVTATSSMPAATGASWKVTTGSGNGPPREAALFVRERYQTRRHLRRRGRRSLASGQTLNLRSAGPGVLARLHLGLGPLAATTQGDARPIEPQRLRRGRPILPIGVRNSGILSPFHTLERGLIPAPFHFQYQFTVAPRQVAQAGVEEQQVAFTECVLGGLQQAAARISPLGQRKDSRQFSILRYRMRAAELFDRHTVDSRHRSPREGSV